MSISHPISIDPALIELYTLHERAAPRKLDPFHCERRVQECAARMIETLSRELDLMSSSANATIRVTESECIVISPFKRTYYTLNDQQMQRITAPYFTEMNKLYRLCQNSQCQSSPLGASSTHTPKPNPRASTSFANPANPLHTQRDLPAHPPIHHSSKPRRQAPFRFMTPTSSPEARIDSVGCTYHSCHKMATPPQETLDLERLETNANSFPWTPQDKQCLAQMESLIEMMVNPRSDALIEWVATTLTASKEPPSKEQIQAQLKHLFPHANTRSISYFTTLTASIFQLKMQCSQTRAMRSQLNESIQKRTDWIESEGNEPTDSINHLLEEIYNIVSMALERVFESRLLAKLPSSPTIHLAHDRSSDALTPLRSRSRIDQITGRKAEGDIQTLHSLLKRWQRKAQQGIDSLPKSSQQASSGSHSPHTLEHTATFSQ